MQPQQAGPQSPRPIRIVSAPQRGPITVCFASEIDGVLTHWPRGRSELCAGEGACPASVHRGHTVWKGFAAGWQWDRTEKLWIACVLEITECGEESLRGLELVGAVYEMERKGRGRKNDPVQLKFVQQRDEAELNTGFPFHRVVERAYHTDHCLWGVPNPLPPREIQGPVSAKGPYASAKPPKPKKPGMTTAEALGGKRLAELAAERQRLADLDQAEAAGVADLNGKSP